MEAYLKWFVEQERFYRLMFIAMVLFGITVTATGAVTANVLLLVLGVFWIVGGGALVMRAANRDPQGE